MREHLYNYLIFSHKLPPLRPFHLQHHNASTDLLNLFWLFQLCNDTSECARKCLLGSLCDMFTYDGNKHCFMYHHLPLKSLPFDQVILLHVPPPPSQAYFASCIITSLWRAFPLIRLFCYIYPNLPLKSLPFNQVILLHVPPPPSQQPSFISEYFDRCTPTSLRLSPSPWSAPFIT